MPLQLVPEADPRQTVLIDKAILFFGRHPECDVVITSSRKVSRKHCCLAQVNSDLVVRDLGSMNGVRVNGRAVHRQATVRVGDTLTVGDVVFHLKEAPAKVSPGSPPRRRPEPAGGSARTRDVSQDVPVVIGDESASIDVEESIGSSGVSGRTPSDVIALSDSDILDEEE